MPQGLSSSVFTRDVSNVFKWLGYVKNYINFDVTCPVVVCMVSFLTFSFDVICNNLLRIGSKLTFHMYVYMFCISELFIILTAVMCRPKGSDCGIVNVNIPTSGAEIGGAFGMTVIFDRNEQVSTKRTELE